MMDQSLILKRPFVDTRWMKTLLNWVPVGMGVVFLLSLAYLQRDRALRGENDFVQLYTGATLVGTPDLYSRPANLAVVQKTLGFTMETVVYTRPPFYAVFLKPMASLPYRVAYALYLLVMLGSIVWFVARFARECPALPLFTAISIPVLTAICGGQDTPLLLVFLGGSILLTRSNRDFLAGLVLSLIAIKFHLFLFIPILLAVKKRWRILAGATIGVTALILIGCVFAGFDTARQYINVLRDPWINPSASIMPNLHGLVAILQGGLKVELALCLLVLLAFLEILRRSDDYEFLFAASLVGGLLVSFHSAVPDDIVLLLVFALVVKSCPNPAPRVAAALILTPIPYFMALSDAPYSAILPAALLLIIGLFCATSRFTSAAIRPTPSEIVPSPIA